MRSTTLLYFLCIVVCHHISLRWCKRGLSLIRCYSMYDMAPNITAISASRNLPQNRIFCILYKALPLYNLAIPFCHVLNVTHSATCPHYQTECNDKIFDGVNLTGMRVEYPFRKCKWINDGHFFSVNELKCSLLHQSFIESIQGRFACVRNIVNTLPMRN